MIYWMRRRPAAKRARGAVLTALAGALALIADVGPAATETPLDLYRERTAMLAVGARCRLFDADLTAALTAGQAEARTAALRAGLEPAALDRAAADARAVVQPLACDSARVRQSADRTRQAFRAYGELKRMTFPGDVGAWRADRAMPVRSASWRLAQDAFAGEDKVTFGLAGQDGAQALTVAVAPADGVAPYAAQLIVRDPARLPEPMATAADMPLSARAPMRAAARIYMAEAMAPADPALRPKGAREAIAFRFPAKAEAALMGLDPREAVGVELLYPSAGGDVTRTAFVEVGDFNAGVAFLKAAQR